jgi:hypothetical protein
MKNYNRQKLVFTKVELIKQLDKMNYNLIDLFNEETIDVGVKALTFNKLEIDYLNISNKEFEKIRNRINLEINYYFCNDMPEGDLINFDYCIVDVEIFPEENYLNRAAIEN